MARYSSGRWSRPATGRQIAALKSHGSYDGKYYSMGRASQAIGRGIASSSRWSAGGYRTPALPVPILSQASTLSELVAGLLGVPDNMESLLAQAIQYAPPQPGSESDPVQSVVFTVAPDEVDPDRPRVQFGATVTREPGFVGDPEIGVQFKSNVEFGEGPPSPPAEFQSGIKFSE
ncbi:MAG: hypothetical protein AB7K08_10320 [Microbacteriaceae bacterium]